MLLERFKAADNEFRRAGARLMTELVHTQEVAREKLGRESVVHQHGFVLGLMLKRRIQEWDDILVVEPPAAFEFAVLGMLALVPEVDPGALGFPDLEPWGSKRVAGDGDATKMWNVHGMIADYADLTAGGLNADLDARARTTAARFREICFSVIDQLDVLASADVPVAPTKRKAIANDACWRAWLNKQLAEQANPDAGGLRDLFDWLEAGRWRGYPSGKRPPNWESFKRYVRRARNADRAGIKPPLELALEIQE